VQELLTILSSPIPGYASHTVCILISFGVNLVLIRCSERYVKTLVERYRDSPTIFAWELANEARCKGDTPGGPNCVAGSGTLTEWYKEQSDFIRDL
jgi:endo-1,4-beta-mannosidase